MYIAVKKTRVLSSVFSKKTLELISQMQLATKENKWIILNSNSWVKGKNNAIAFAEKNNLKIKQLANMAIQIDQFGRDTPMAFVN